MTRKRIKQKITKVTRLPGNAVVMSLMAVILLCGAPALITMIDESDSVEYSKVVVLDDDILPESYIRTNTDETPFGTADYSYLPALGNDGYHTIVLNDSSVLESVSFYRIYFDSSSIDGVSTVEVVTDSSSVLRFGARSTDNPDATMWKSFVQSESDPSIWTYGISSVDAAKFASGYFDMFFLDFRGDITSSVEFKVSVLSNPVIQYGEIIVGATGVLLMICAVLATPYFGLSGYTGPRPKTKRRR